VRVRISVIFCIVCIFLVSCSLFRDPDSEVVIDIEKEFYLEMFEDLNENFRNFAFKIETIKEQNCLNSEIVVSSYMSSQNILIQIFDINDPSDCVPGNAPASKLVYSQVAEGKDYDVQITLGDAIENTGILKVFSDKYLFNLSSEHGFELKDNILWRIPEYLIWGFAGCDNPSLESRAKQFNTDLESISEEIELEKGNFGFFTVLESGLLEFKEVPSPSFYQPFYFYFSGDPQLYKDLVDTYRSEYPDLAIEIRIYTGEIY